MKKRLLFFVLASFLLLFINRSPAQAETSTHKTIVIDTQKLILVLLENHRPVKTYQVGLGTKDTPSPVGNWQVIGKSKDWGTGFGTRILVLDVPWGKYGIHGTNKPWSVGQYKSHGCIRMRNQDVEQLFELVPTGTPVRIVGNPFGYYPGYKRTLFRGQRGADVVELQTKLIRRGYLQGKADGIFGYATEVAVKQFQKDHKLEVSGQVNMQFYVLLGY